MKVEIGKIEKLEKYLKSVDDRAGKDVEAIAIAWLKRTFPDAKINAIDEASKQALYGDLKITFDDNKKHYIEVKTSNTFNRADSLVMDYKYYELTRIKYYFQKNTESHLGWLWTNNLVDWLLVYNKESQNIYLIDNYQEFRQNILNTVRNYFKDLQEMAEIFDYVDKGKVFDDMAEYMVLTGKIDTNKIDEYIKLPVIKDGNLKRTIGAGIMLNKETIEAYNGKFYKDEVQFVERIREMDKTKEPVLLFN